MSDEIKDEVKETQEEIVGTASSMGTDAEIATGDAASLRYGI